MFNRMNVSFLRSGATDEGMSREVPDVAELVTTSDAESTQSETSEDWTLTAT